MAEHSPPYSSRQLASLARTKLRTLRRWLAADLLSPTVFRGPATAYGARHLDEVRVICRLRAENLPLAEIRKRLRSLSDVELARVARPGAHPEEPQRAAPTAPAAPVAVAAPAAPAGAVAAPTAAPEPSPSPAPSAVVESAEPSPRTPATAAYPASRWEHVVLLPGLELRVRSDGGALLRRIAQEIYAQYGTAAP